MNLECRQELDVDWAFCPRCGSDNRPPEGRAAIPYHDHHFVGDQPCCTLCGCVEGMGAGSRRRQRFLGSISLIAGLIVMAGFLNFMVVLATDSGLYSEQIQALYRAGSRRSSVGSTVATILLAVGLFFCCFGFAVLSPRPNRRSRPPSMDGAYWNYEDDKPWWKRRRSGWWR